MSGSIGSPFALAPSRYDFMHRLPQGNFFEDPSMPVQPPAGNYPILSVPDGAVRQQAPTENQGWMPVSSPQANWNWLLHPAVLSALHQHLVNLLGQLQASPYQGQGGPGAVA